MAGRYPNSSAWGWAIGIYWHPCDAPLTLEDRHAIARTHLTIVTYDPDTDPEVLAATLAVVVACVARVPVEQIPDHCDGVSLTTLHRLGPLDLRATIMVPDAEGPARVHPEAFYWLRLCEPRGHAALTEPVESAAWLSVPGRDRSDLLSGSFSKRTYVVLFPGAGKSNANVDYELREWRRLWHAR